MALSDFDHGLNAAFRVICPPLTCSEYSSLWSRKKCRAPRQAQDPKMSGFVSLERKSTSQLARSG